ncbi:MAG: ATP-dependent protease LonB [Thermoplasmatales archaeon]|nr:ATP-dependent protease LonB [Candidatus Thermoplasmatota archaeon]MCG2825893.1 ATP-dependent protease LonB [Thermoplasmatales archaeon]
METVESWIDKQEFKTTNDVKVPKVIVEQVIGQEKAVEVIKKAAEQKRHVMLIGEPGTGKSMLARSMAELLPKGKLEDVIAYPNPEDSNMPKVRVVPAGKGKNIVNTQKIEAVKRKSQKTSMMMLIIFMIVGFAVIYFLETGNIMVVFYGIIAAAILFWVFWMTMFRGGPMMKKDMVPKLLISHKPDDIPPFIDATGAHAGALLGDIRHDPFQSGGLETPAHERVEIGALQKANKGVLFIDEINTLRLESQQNLLTAMQEKKFSISGQSERSAGAMVKTEPVPCDFILVVAGNLDAVKGMHPALRSRIRGYGYEIYMKSTMPDNDENRKKLVRFVAQEIKNDAKIPHFDKNAVGEIIREAQRRSGRKGELSLRLRELGGLVRIAGDIAVEIFVKSMPNKEDAMKIVKEKAFVTAENILSAKKIARSLEQQVADRFIEKGKEYKSFKTTGYEVGAVNGLAVLASDPSMAEYSGVVLPIVAEVTPAGSRSEGKIIATGKLGEIAKEAVQNVSALIKKYTGKDISNYDVHIQFIGTHEGVEGDSASISVAAAIISAMENVEIDQTVGMTGSLSIRGGVLPVGGITAKIEAAAESGLKKVLIPKANLSDVLIEEKYRNKIEIIPVETLKDVLSNALAGSVKKEGLLEKLAKLVPKRTELPLPSGA